MKRALLCVFSFGTILFIFVEFSVGLNEVLAEKRSTISFFRPSQVTEPVDTTLGKIELSFPVDIKFPYAIAGTNLVVERIVSYDGPFLEDGSNDEVLNVMGVMLRNIGNEGIIHAEVMLFREGEKFVFKADTIPPGKMVLVLEKGRSCYTYQNFALCSGWQITDAENWSNSEIIITETGMGTLQITNRMGKELSQIRLHYKTYLEEILVGGITHVYTIKSLNTEETVFITPERYAKGYSCIVRIEVENKNHRQGSTAGGE